MKDSEKAKARRFGLWLEEKFAHAGISEREFARRAHVAVTTPRTWRGGLSVPKYGNVPGMASALGVPLREAMVAAGYLVESDDVEATAPDAEVTELLAAWEELDLQGREVLLATTRALLGRGRAAAAEEGPEAPTRPVTRRGSESA